MPSRSPAPVALCALHTQEAQFAEINPGPAFYIHCSLILISEMWDPAVETLQSFVHSLSLTTLLSSSCSSSSAVPKVHSLSLLSENSWVIAVCPAAFLLKPSSPLSSPPVVAVLIRRCSERSDFTTASGAIASLFSASLFVSPLPLYTSASPSGGSAVMLFRRTGGLMEPQPSFYYI